MKKSLSILLALALIFALAACGGQSTNLGDRVTDGIESVQNSPASEPEPTPEPTPEPKLTGSWRGETDMFDALVEQLGDDNPDVSELLHNYVKEYIFVMDLDLREDGSFTLTADLSKAAEHMLEAFRQYLRAKSEEAGYAMSDEDIETTAQSAVQSIANASLPPVEGTYEVQDGMLTLGDSTPSPYVLTGDTLSFSLEEFGDLTFERIG